MTDTDGLLADAQPSDDNQQEAQESISHIEPGTQTLQPATQEASNEDAEPVVRPDWYPEKFWSEEEGPDLENLVKSYNELQKKFSQGKHKSPESYDEAVFRDAGIAEDDALLSSYRDWAKQNGISQAAFEDLAGKFIEMAGTEAQQAKVSYEAEFKKLGPNADATIKSMTDWAQGLVRKGVWGQTDFEEFKIMGGTADGLRALQKIRSYYGDQSVPIDVAPTSEGPSREELMAMVGKPEYISDPSYRAKVEKMFERMYGNDPYSPS
jgi:hypothetical protein